MVSRSVASSSSLTETACNTRFGSMLPDADDQQDAGHADDAFGGTSRILARPKPIEHADYSFHCPARTGRTDRLWRRHLMRLPDGSAAF
jgi:hypothetical protein